MAPETRNASYAIFCQNVRVGNDRLLRLPSSFGGGHQEDERNDATHIESLSEMRLQICAR